VRVRTVERDLVLLARAVLEGRDYEANERILRREAVLEGLPAPAMRLFEDTLVKGAIRALARLGGARSRRWEAAGAKEGRVWDAFPRATWAFSRFSFALCRWLVVTPLGTGLAPTFVTPPETWADELLAFLVCAWVDGRSLERDIGSQPGVRASTLAWLGCPRMLGSAPGPMGLAPDRMDALVGPGEIVVAGLGDELARRAVAHERDTAKVRSPSELLRLGGARRATLELLLDALEKSGRWDLASFLVDAGAALLAGPEVDERARVPKLDRAASLGDRQEARRAAASLYRALRRLGRRHEAARSVRFLDEDYPAAQLLLARWEGLGSVGFARAERVLSAFEEPERD
jgi:hypothetical protein